MASVTPDPDTIGHDLRMAVGRLARRLRQLYNDGEAAGDPRFLEISVLTRLRQHGSSTPGALADAEGVSAQAVGSVVTALVRRRLITRTPDPADGRRAIIGLTASGRRLVDARGQVITERLAEAIGRDLNTRDQRRLAEFVPLLERLAERL